jgi:ribulose-phosphate 3-epimerase
MTVNPGWGGQPYIETSNAKIAELRERLPEGVPLEIDGGVDVKSVEGAAEAGANLFVAGSSLFGKPDPGAAYTELAGLIDAE